MIRISIRKFTLLGICLGTILLLSFYTLLNSFLLNRTFSEFENNALANDVIRVNNALEEEVHKLDEIVVDWAIWDDSALFMQGKMKNYVKSNLNDRTLDSLHLSFIMFVDTRGKIVWAHNATDQDTYTSDMPEEIKSLVFNGTSILTDSTQEKRIHGIANLPHQLMIIASCPILDSEGKGPNQGMLLMGRQLTDAMLTKVSEKVRLQFNLEDKEKPLPDDMHSWIRTISTGADENTIDIYDKDEDTLSGVMLVKSISGDMSLRLTVFRDKDIMRRGAAVTMRSSILLAIGGAILIGSILFLVERRILSRIISIKKQINRINSDPKDGGGPNGIVISGEDEINTLANHINSYIAEINNYKTNLERIVLERTNDLRQKVHENEQGQKELKKAKEVAEEANKTKTEFLAKVTHEIRTPMNSIKGMNDYLLSTPLNSDQVECLTVIKESSSHLLTIVNDLLDLSKIEAGQLTFEHIDFNLKQLIDSTVKILLPQANKKKLVFQVEYQGRTDVAVKGDPARIRQILFNLVNNALKFTPFGEVRIVVATAWDVPNGVYDVTISVKDTGIGITEEALQRIFEPFVQSDNSTTRKFGGTGLGLSICKQLVTLMGGRIAISSQPGVGSEFTFVLSLPPGNANLVAQPGAATPFPYMSLDRLTILVVDDNEMNLRVAQKVFSLLNQEPVLAKGGKEALEILTIAIFDIIFLDIEMPDINGLEVTRIIRTGKAAPLNQDTHIVAMTAYSLNTIKDQCLQQGMNDFITKPLDQEVLFRILQSFGRNPAPDCPPHDGEETTDWITKTLVHPHDRAIVNVESALRKLGADKELYLDICKGFLETFNAERFSVLYLSHLPDLISLPLFIHSLKGNSLQIGAERISFLAERLEKKLVCDRDDIHEDLLLLKDQILLVEDRLRTFMSDCEKEESQAPVSTAST